MGHSSDNRVQLEDLLKLKRLEKPDSDFWDGFDRRLEQRRLQALISGSELESSRLMSSLKWLLWAAPVAAAVMLGMLFFRSPWSHPATGGETLVEASSPVLPAATGVADLRAAGLTARPATFASMAADGRSESRFVHDVLSNRSEELPFQRVLANPAFSGGARSDARFVADQLTSRAGMMPVTLLVDRPRSQF